MSWFQRLSGFVVLSSLLLGCGGYKATKGVTVKGKLTKGGAPLTVPNMDIGVGTIKVELFPIHSGLEDERSSEGTLGKADGTFEIVGAGKGVKPGKYRLGVIADPGTGDELGGKFSAEA